MSGIGDKFELETKYRREQLPREEPDWTEAPETYKSYPGHPRIRLPSSSIEGGPSIWPVVAKRRSVRDFLPEQLSKEDLSRLLWASQGVTGREEGYELRAAPSAGGLYPVETYVLVNDVAGVERGVYHYSVLGHELEQLRKGDFRTQASQAALDQDMAYHAPVVFIWTAIFQRSKWKYGQRAYRYVYLDAGHIAQNLALAAVALGLGSCQIGALYDDEVNALIGVDGVRESVVYMSVVGKPS